MVTTLRQARRRNCLVGNQEKHRPQYVVVTSRQNGIQETRYAADLEANHLY